MHYAAAFIALAVSTAAWPQSHNNSSTVTVSGSSSNTKPSFVNTGTIRSSSLPSGSSPSSRYVHSTGASVPKSSAAKTGITYSSGLPSGRLSSSTYIHSTGASVSKPSAINTGIKHSSGLPFGYSSSSNHVRSTGSSLPAPSASASSNTGHQTIGASGTGHGHPPPATTQGPPPKTIHVTVPGIPSASTKTNLITTTSTAFITKFVPCSSAVATQSGTTYYSSSLTTSVATSTMSAVITEYTVLCPAPTAAGSSPAQGSGSQGQSSGSSENSNPGSSGNSNAGSAGEICAPASTVYHTVYVTVTGPVAGSRTEVSGSPSSPGSANSQPQPPFQSQPNVAPFPLASNHHTAPLPSGSGTGTARPSGTGAYITKKSSSTGVAKPTGSSL